MAQIYEGMFLLDNEVVRESWNAARSLVTDVLTKNGATIHTARRWDERKLAYPVKRRERASYLLAYYEIPREGIPSLIRDLDLSERILRYLLTCAEAVPAGEAELSEAEQAADFSVPEPPPDNAGTWAAVQGPVEDEEGDEQEEEASDEGSGEAKQASDEEAEEGSDEEPEPQPVGAGAKSEPGSGDEAPSEKGDESGKKES